MTLEWVHKTDLGSDQTGVSNKKGPKIYLV